jgi:hypothetical protein
LTPNCTESAGSGTQPPFLITIHSNNHGFRDYKDYRFGKSEGVSRILVLGDSFGYGNAVEELGRYSSLLDDLLGEEVEVYNLAISNYGLDQALLTLQSEGLRYGTDVIVVGFSDPMLERLSRKAPDSFWNGPFVELGRDGVLESGSQPSERLLAVESLLDQSYLWLFASRRVSRGLRKLRSSEEAVTNAELAEKVIERLVEISTMTKTALVIFTINADYTLRRSPPTMPDVNRVLEKASRNGGFQFLDLYPVFKSSNYASLFHPIDGHYNIDGHILVAEQLCGFIRSRGILPESGSASSCDVDREAVYRSIELFRSCSISDANEALFPGGECIPRP